MTFNVTLTILLISIVAWMVGFITMHIPHKIAYRLTWISFYIVAVGTVISVVLTISVCFSGGTIYR